VAGDGNPGGHDERCPGPTDVSHHADRRDIIRRV